MRNVVLGAFASLLLAACGGGGGGGGDQTYIAGRVMLGPVDGATVVAYRVLDTGALGASLGAPVTTDSQGRYRFLVEAGFSGLAGVVATEGTYVDEATGATITDPELELIGFATVVENQTVTAQVNALTTVAAHCALELAREAGTTAADAVANAAMMVEEYFGISDLLTAEPAELTAGPVAAGNAAEYGAANAGFSQLAADMDAPLMDVIDALGWDGADCTLAGDFYGGEVEVWTHSGVQPVPVEAGGRMLADAVVDFLESARNQSGLGDADVQVDETIEGHIIAGGEGEFSFIMLPPRVDEFLPPVGEVAGGTVVVFRGEHLASDGGTMQVTFGGLPATVLDEDDEVLEVATPPRAVAGKVDVRITDPVTGLYVVLHEAFEYYTPGLAPTITRIWPELGPVTGGTLIDVTGTNFDPTAVVRVGGQPAEVVAYLGRTALVVAAPPNATPGDYDVVLWQSSGSGAPSTTLPDAFEYRTRDVSLGFDDGDVAGAWRIFAIDYGTSDYDAFSGVVADATFDGAGEVTQSGTAFVTSPTVPEGTLVTIPPETRGYALFEDGTLWFENPEDAVVAHLADEADVFAYGQVATDHIHTIGVGVRRGSGMSNASLTGTWHVAAFGHTYWNDGRYVTSALGIAEFDGAGGGTVSLLSGEVAGVDGGSASRAADVGGLDYSVNGDGTLTMELLDPDGGDPFLVEGILAQRGDLLVGLGRSDGETMLVIMTPHGRGFVNDWGHGSWRGMAFGYEYDPVMFAQVENGTHRYTSEAFRILTDAAGAALIDIEDRTSDVPDRGVREDMFLDRLPLNPSGWVGGGPSDVLGFMSPSRRFMVFLPTSFAAGPDTDPVDWMGVGLLLRGPSFYSKFSIEGRHPMAGTSKEFINPDDPPQFTEELSQFLTVVSFFPSQGLVIEDGSHDGMGVARQVSDRMEKIVRRHPDGSVEVDLPEPEPWLQGGYAVGGDGRLYLFLYEEQQLTANPAQLLQMLIGDLTPDGSVTVMHLPKGLPASGTAVLVPESETDVPIDGLYHFGQFDLAYDNDEPSRGSARAAIGVLDFDAGDGSYTGEIEYFTAYEFGGSDNDDAVFEGEFEVIGSFFGSGDIVGIATPDGSAMFNLNFDTEVTEVNLSIALRAPEGPVASAGSYRQAEMYHEYLGLKPGEGADLAMFETGQGNFSVRQTFDAAFELTQHSNTAPFEEFTDMELEMYPDASLGVNTDGSVSWPIFGGVVMRGWFDASGRFLFLVPTDPSSELPNLPTLTFIYRR